MGFIVSGSRWLWCKCLKLPENWFVWLLTKRFLVWIQTTRFRQYQPVLFLLPAKILQSHLLTLKSYWVHEKNLLMTCWWLAQKKWYKLSVSYPDSYLSESKMNRTNKLTMTQILCVEVTSKARHLLNQFSFIWLYHTTGRRICLTKQEFHFSRCLLCNCVFPKIGTIGLFYCPPTKLLKGNAFTGICMSFCLGERVPCDHYPRCIGYHCIGSRPLSVQRPSRLLCTVPSASDIW